MTKKDGKDWKNKRSKVGMQFTIFPRKLLWVHVVACSFNSFVIFV